RTVELKRPTGVEWAKRIAIIAIEGFVISWRATLFGRMSNAVLPGAVGNDVLNRNIINQHDRFTLTDSDTGLEKIRVAHMHSRATGSSITNTTGCQNGGQNSQQGHSNQQLFIHKKKPFQITSIEVQEMRAPQLEAST